MSDGIKLTKVTRVHDDIPVADIWEKMALEAQICGMNEAAAWARWESQPRLLVAAAAADDWMQRFVEYGDIVFDGTEMELLQSLQDAIESAQCGKIRDEFYIIVAGSRLIPADLHQQRMALLAESNHTYRQQCARLTRELKALHEVTASQQSAMISAMERANEAQARVDELTAVLQRIADLAGIGEGLPTAANFKNIHQHAKRALEAGEGK